MTDTTKRLIAALAVLLADYKERYEKGEKINETALKFADMQFSMAIENDKELLEILQSGGEYEFVEGVKVTGNEAAVKKAKEAADKAAAKNSGIQIMSYESGPGLKKELLNTLDSALDEPWNLHLERVKQGKQRVKN